MGLTQLLVSLVPWIGRVLGLTFSILVIGGIAVLIDFAGAFYYWPKLTIKSLSGLLSSR